jgi:hypothetical protein
LLDNGLIACCHQPRERSLGLDLPEFEAFISNRGTCR